MLGGRTLRVQGHDRQGENGLILDQVGKPNGLTIGQQRLGIARDVSQATLIGQRSQIDGAGQGLSIGSQATLTGENDLPLDLA
jgi:hypothetical protein